MNREPRPASPPVTQDVRWLSVAAFLVIALAALTIFMNTASYFIGPKVFQGIWEDSLMLVRYAHNLAKYHEMVWNAGGEHAYGLTSPYYFLLVVIPVSKYLTAQALAIPVMSSLICGVLFFIALAFLLFRFLPGPRLYRHLAIAAIAFSLARNSGDLAIHMTSGMDTYFGLLYFTIYIALARWFSLWPTVWSAILTGLFGGLAFGARPDVLAWTVLIPLIWVILVPERKLPVVMLSATIVVLVVQLAFTTYYFHSPLPLPFYAKSTQMYPGLTGYRGTAIHHFIIFLISYWLLFLLVALDCALNARRWWRDTSPLEKGLLAGIVAHMSYFLFVVTQIMPYAQRFYYPALPALIYLAANAAIRLLGGMPGDWISSLTRVAPPYRWAVIAAAVLVLPPHVGDLSTFSKFAHRDFATFDLMQEYRVYLETYWFGLDFFSTLPNDFTMATTEVGHVAALNLDKVVVDIAGLNDPLFVRHRFSADVFFQHYHPDLIYMPHPGYRAMKEDMENNSLFKADYDFIPAEKLGIQSMGIAMRRSSKYYPEMRKMVSESCAQHLAGDCSL